MADFPAIWTPRTKTVKAYDWCDEEWFAAFKATAADTSRPALEALGRWSRAIDDDAQLLLMAGIALDRMEVRTYQAEPLRWSMAVDGKVVREYTVKFAVHED